MINCNPLVFVRCFTYNQSNYIIDALNGFVMQKTSFPYVCCIVDDSSTDGEQEVINHYCEEHFDFQERGVYLYDETDDYIRYFARHKTNPNCFFIIVNLKYNHYSIKKDKMPYFIEWCNKTKYLALCEGDDYWTDSLKLQKQVDFMESHQKCSLCFTANIRLSSNGNIQENRYLQEDCSSCSFEDYLVSEFDKIDTCTMLYKTTLLLTLPEWYYKVGVGDIPYKLILFSKGDVGYINDITGCYRINSVSSWTSRMSQNYKMRCLNRKRILQMWKDFDEWTENKYHKYIKKKIFVLKKRNIKSEMVLFFNSMKRMFSHEK